MSLVVSLEKISMLKIIFRILVILLAAGLVCGGLFLVANTAGANLNNFSGGLGRAHFDGALTNGSRPAPPDGAFQPGGRGGEQAGGSLLGLAGVAGILGKVAVITAAVVLLQGVSGRFFRKRRTIRASV
jgi:hypothetical protein